MKPGTRVYSAEDDCEVIVVRPATTEVTLTYGGQPMLDHRIDSGRVGSADGPVQTQVGKRYRDLQTSLELLCVKAGYGQLAVDGRPLEQVTAKPLPASD
jgi:hypothetical protein